MKRKFVVKALAMLLSASVILSSSSSGMGVLAAAFTASAVNNSASDVSDASSAVVNSAVSIEGDQLLKLSATGITGGDGTEANPYLISDVAELLAVKNYINDTTSGDKYFRLENDIDLSSVSFSDFTNFEDIFALVSATPSLSGNADVFFDFDGNGKKLYNLNVTVPSGIAAVGIFGYVNVNSSIRNLTFENITINNQYSANIATAVGAVQNFGVISGCSFINPKIDMTSAVSTYSAESSVLSAGKVYTGYAVVVSDNAGTVTDCNITVSDPEKGIILVKGDRRFVGGIVGQNRNSVSDCTVTNLRIFSYGSDDSGEWLGNGSISSYVGAVAGRNNVKANRTSPDPVISGCTVNLTSSLDIVYGDYVGGIAGFNGGLIEECEVNGDHTTYGSSPSADASDFYGFGRFGGIAGGNSGTISVSGAYDAGFVFSKQSEVNAYGGIVGFNSGKVDACVTSGYADNSSQSAAGVGGIIGNVQSGSAVTNCYAFVKIAEANDYAASVLGKNATVSHLGTTNYWTSLVSSVPYAVPNNGVAQNEITSSLSVLNVPMGAGGLTVERSTMTHSGSPASVVVDVSKNATVSTSEISVTNTTTGFRLTSGIEGACGELQYFVNIILPSGIGIDGKSVSQRFYVPVIVSASAENGAGTTPSNPILITTYTQLKFIKNAPTAHYKLGADINTDASWVPFAFSGTLDGDGYTVNVRTALFSDVSGSRNSDIESASWKNDPANLISGYVHDINIVAVSSINGPVIRNVRNATLSDITYSASSGAVAQINSSKSGAFIGEIGGNVYMNGCYVSTPVEVTSVSSDGIAALIGYVSANNYIIDNCGSSSVINSGSNLSKVAGLVGFIASVSGKGYITNNYATGSVRVSGTVGNVLPNIMIGAIQSMTNLTLAENYYSVADDSVDGYSVSLKAAPVYAGINEFDFEKGAYDVAIDAVTTSSISLSMPSGMTVFSDAVADEFEFSVDSSDVRIVDGTAVVSNGVLTFDVVSTVTDEFSTNLTVTHTPTLFKASTTLRSGLRLSGGYYEIYTVADLQEIADGFADTNTVDTYRTAKYKLCADIDMTGETLAQMSTSAETAFEGVFIGKDIGEEKYTISNLTLTGTKTGAGISAFGLFGYANGAEFGNFALETVSVSNTGMGVGLLVGYADSDSATDCKFHDIDINNCTVTSTYSGGTGIALTNMSEMGVLVGSVRSTSTGEVYSFKDITVTNTTVKNENDDGNYGAGGLIGSSYTAGTLVIGEALSDTVTEPSIVIDNVDVEAFGYVGGIIGIAGALPNGTASNAVTGYGGLSVNNVLVMNSDIIAGKGYVGGVVGTETCDLSKVNVLDCTVRECLIVSEGLNENANSSVSDAGGIAGHFSGTVENCTVDSVTIKSCFAGGIVCRSSRKASTQAGTNVTIKNCNVIGDTEITDNGTGGTVNELGGILANARSAGADIQKCGVGPDVYIHGGAKYVGGIIGACNSSNTTYKVYVTDCISYATVEIAEAPAEADESAAGGLVGYSNINMNSFKIKTSVAAGEVNCNGGIAAGIIGSYYKNTNGTDLIVDCTVTSLINANSNGIENFTGSDKYAAKIIGYTAAYGANYWMGPNNFTKAIHGIVTSTYPQADRFYGYATSSDIQTRDTTHAYLGSFSDINKPNGMYLDGSASGVVIDGSVSVDADITISNEPNVVDGNDMPRITFDTSSDDTLIKYNGWNSVANGILTVTGATVASDGADAVVSVTAKKNSTSTGITANYYVPGITVPGTEDGKVLVPVFIPVVCQNISAFNLSGDGSESNPYVIMTKDDLDAVRFGGADKHYVLGADIEFTDADFSEGGFFYNNGSFFAPITFSDGSGNTVPFTGSFSGYHNGVLYYLGGLKINSQSANAGLFAEAQNASFTDLYLDKFSVTTSNGRAGVVVGTASNVVFDDIQIYSATVRATEYAGTVAAYVTDADADKISIDTSTLTSACYIGGVFGHAFASSASAVNEITNSTLTNININSVASSDIVFDIAAGIVGEFFGNISNVELGGNGTINGSRASGAVGRVGFGEGVTATQISKVTVDGNYSVVSERSNTMAAAAGILAKINNASDDEQSDSTGTLTVNLTIDDCYVGENVDINAVFNAGGIIGSAESWKRGFTKISDCQTRADVKSSVENGANGFAGAIIGLSGGISVLSIENCVAGGTVSAPEGAGGVIGVLYDYNISVNHEGALASRLTDAVIKNVVVSAKITNFGIATSSAKGIVIGSVDSTVIPAGLSVVPFRNVYYSSYQNDMGVTGNATVNSAGYDVSVCDLQENFSYTDGVDVLPMLPISGDGLVLGTDNIILGTDGQLNTGAVSGNYRNFTVPENIGFVLDTVNSVDALGNPKEIFDFDKSTYTFTIVSEGSGLAEFCYENGIKVTLNVTSFDIDGAGTEDNPYIITSVSHMMFVADYPNKHFVLGADIDFTYGENADTWPESWFTREDGWADKGIAFTGTLTGSYFEFDEQTGEYTDTEKIYAIKNLTIESDSMTNVGFFSVLEGSVTDIIFENCTFISTASGSNAGSVAGTNNGTVSGIVVTGGTVSAQNSAGAVVGYSAIALSDCDVTAGTTVTSAHAAGGIAGSALTVSDSTVSGAVISATDYAAGVVASNIGSVTASSSYTNCTVSDTTITADYIAAGILGLAETATSTGWRSLTIENCTIGSDVSVTTNGRQNSATSKLYYGYAAGILGRLNDRYNGLVIRTNESYATVTANGDAYINTSNFAAAGAIIGATIGSTSFRPTDGSGNLTFTIVNNVAGGVIRSAGHAGGIAGRLAFQATNNNYKIRTGDFLSHNIISAVFETVVTASGDPGANTNFAVVASFIEGTGLFSSYDVSLISNNYYSSYVSTVGNPSITPLGPTSEITECGLVDVAKDSNGNSSFTVKNNRYEWSEYEMDGEDYARDDKGFLIPTDEAVTTGMLSIDSPEIFFESTVIGYHFSEYQDSREYVKPVQFIFTGSEDLGILNAAHEVYNGGDGTERSLSLLGLNVTPAGASSYYSSEMSSHNGRIASSFTVLSDNETEAFLVADLGYGLKVGISISASADGSVANGSISSPYLIKSAADFAYYFFGSFANTVQNDYLGKYYKQTNDISFEDVLNEIALLDPAVALSNVFAPIGNTLSPFRGGYDGNEKVITGFTYSGTDADTGLFGYVTGDSASSADYRLRDIHIELGEAGVSGGQDTGGLVGHYNSNCEIYNCSVVYSTVTGTTNVGGLVGNICSTTLDGCFTSTDVRASDVTSSNGDSGVGGIVGYLSTVNTTDEKLSYINCFSSSDSVAYQNTAGFVGRIYCTTNGSLHGNIDLENCSFTGSVTAMRYESDETSYDPTNTPIVVGHYSTGAIGAARMRSFVTAKNVIVAGTNTTEYATSIMNTGDSKSKIYYPVLFGTAPLLSGTDVYYDASVIGRITVPKYSTTDSANPYQMWVNGDVYDITGTDIQTGDNLTGGILNSNTAELTSMTSFGDAENWDCSDSDLYPVVVMRDEYSDAFAKVSAIPVYVDERESDDTNEDSFRDYKGLTYPLTVKKTVDGNEITLNASVYSAASDTVLYNEAYDRGLYGNGGTTKETSNMKTDILFKDSEDGVLLLRNSYLDSTASTLRDEKSPYVTLSASVDGYDVNRNIRIPLRGEENAVFIATERQLRAIMNAQHGLEHAGKFHDAYIGALTKNVYICADIDLNGDVNFEPISGYGANAISFEGSNCIISNLYISKGDSNTGFFDVLNTNNLEVKNVVLNNVNVNGAARTGALVGYVSGNVLFNNCLVVADSAESKVAGTIDVGGLIGRMEGGFIGYKSTEAQASEYTPDQVSGSAVKVNGTNFVGGFVGYAAGATISNSFATGDVKRIYDPNYSDANYFNNGVSGFGGFVGYAELSGTAGKIQYTFASGSVEADYGNINTSGAASAYTVGVGGFAGIAKMDIQNCFSSGDVFSGTDSISSNNGVNFGVGGLVGYSTKTVSNAYSSSMVKYELETGVVPTLAGVGGVVGISTSVVSYVYSSGSVWSTFISDDSPVKLGGVVGNGTTVDRVYYDTWTNNIKTLKAVGNIDDSEYVRGFTTEEFCNGTLVNQNYLTSADWGYDKSDNPNSYPYLKEFCKDYVSDYVRYPAVLSVVAVRPNDRDEAVREGRGYSMALTMPTSLTMDYINTESGETTQRIYYLEWAAGSELGADSGEFAGGLIKYGNNTFAPIRTSNTQQYLQLVSWVERYEENGKPYDNDGAADGYREYGIREVSKLYQMMLGTEEYPYLISTSLDLRHIGFNADGGNISSVNGDYGQYPDFYDRWYSPINIENLNENVSGKVYYKLISNVDMTKSVVIHEDGTASVETVNNTSFLTIPGMDGNVYAEDITFMGYVIDGDDYAIVNYVSDAPFIGVLDGSENASSEIKDIIFDKISISAEGDASLIGTNNGTVDGLIVMGEGNTFTSATGNAAAIVSVNNGTVVNSIADADITGAVYVGGIVADNNGTVDVSVSDSVLTAAEGTVGIGSIAGRNAADGVIRESVSLGSVVGTDSSVTGGFVGVNDGTISDSYSRTAVSGSFGNAGSFCGTNSGEVSNAFSAGRTTVSSVTASDKGSAFVGTNSGTLENAVADKALLGSDTYMLIGDSAVTEDIIAGVCFDSEGFAESKNNAYPQLKALTAGDPEEAEGSETADGYERIKYRLLEAYSNLSAVTVDSAYSNYIDILTSAQNLVSSVPDGYSVTPSGAITSGSGAVTATAPSVSQKIGAGTNTQDDITYVPKFSFDYAVKADVQNPNFTDGDGSLDDPYIIGTSGDYTAEDSFESLSYYGMANDASLRMSEDVSFDGENLSYPIRKLASDLDGAGYTVSDVTVTDNTSLFGDVTGDIKNLGIAGIVVDATVSEDGMNFGLLASKVTGAEISNVFAVGELKVEKADDLSANVGGLVGYLDNSTLSGVVTSGYISNACTGADSTVGGIAGFADGGQIVKSESTAYVFGDVTVGGIAGKSINNTVIGQVIFAGTAADTVLTTYEADASEDTAVIGQIIGSGTASDAYYDKQVALFTDGTANARSTSQLVKLQIAGFTNDASVRYYPNPISVANMSEAFKTGLNFALARINVSLAGGEGAINCYDQVSVTSPVNKAADTVSLTEDRARFNDANSYMTVSTSSSLLPNGGSARGFTGIKATLNDGADSSFYGNVNDIYRYLEVYIVRVIEIDYVLIDNTQNDIFGDDTDVALMVRPEMEGALRITSNAITSINEDADTSSGDYKVKFNKIVVSGNGFTVDTLLPEGFEAEPFISASDMGEGYSGSVSETDANFIELGETDKVKLYVAISESGEVWGLQDIDGGLG